MNTHNTTDEIVEQFDKKYVVHCSDGDILDGIVDAKKVKIWLVQTLHRVRQSEKIECEIKNLGTVRMFYPTQKAIDKKRKELKDV